MPTEKINTDLRQMIARVCNVTLSPSSKSVLILGHGLPDFSKELTKFRQLEVAFLSEDSDFWDEDHYSLIIACLNDMNLTAARQIHNHCRKAILFASGEKLQLSSIFSLAREKKFDLKNDWRIVVCETLKDSAVILLESK